MGPDDAGARVVLHQDFDSDVVGVGMQIEVVLDREIDGLFYPLGISRLAREVEFADAAVIAAFEFVPYEVEDGGVAEPGLDVGTDAIRPDEGDDMQARRLGVNKGMRAGV